jgi:hypothetical protein
MRVIQMGDDDKENKGTLRRLANKRRARLAADSAMSFKKYAAKMSLIVFFLFLDGLIIPSVFQSYGLLNREFVLPIGLILLLAIALQAGLISRIK